MKDITKEAGARLFRRILNYANSCSKQSTFHPSINQLDCDYCPEKQNCCKFWDEFVVNLPSTAKERKNYIAFIVEKMKGFKAHG